eukprot:10324189-Ditylum_brightwellii.AAC.1
MSRGKFCWYPRRGSKIGRIWWCNDVISFDVKDVYANECAFSTASCSVAAFCTPTISIPSFGCTLLALLSTLGH